MAYQPNLETAQELALQAYANGATVEKAMGAVGRSYRTWESWRKNYPDFARRADEIREARKRPKGEKSGDGVAVPVSRDISFEDFRKEYLGQDTYRHHRAWIDVIEGRDYTPLPGETFVVGKSRKRVLINTPPFHSKSTVLTMDYAVYRICMNPNVRIIIVSKTQNQAKKFLLGIKRRLTGPQYGKLQAAFAPDGGFVPEKGQGEWSTTRIYVAGSEASEEKDPTVEALGIGGQIYGARADLIILDDVADVGNAHQFETHINYIQQDVMSRLFVDGLLLVVGTRVGAQDIYSELLSGKRYLSGTSPWTHLAQPAVLSFADDPKDWVTLWPRSSRPLDPESDDPPGPDGLYRAWDGPALAEVRDSIKPSTWSLVYQQQAVAEDATFRPTQVWGSVDRRRKAGPLTAGAWGHPRNGKEGMWTIASMDPAMSGETFTIVGAVDRVTNKRWIENAWVQAKPPASYFRDHIKRVTDEYRVNEWVIEEQGFQGFLVHDPEIRAWLANRGVRMTGHYTGKNKVDPEFGVASLAGLFGTSRRINEGAGREVFDKGSNLIELPDPDSSPGVMTLIEELLTWEPDVRGSKLRQDGPMALWFWETRARVMLGVDRPGAQQTHIKTPFMMRGTRKRQVAAPFSWARGRGVLSG